VGAQGEEKEDDRISLKRAESNKSGRRGGGLGVSSLGCVVGQTRQLGHKREGGGALPPKEHRGAIEKKKERKKKATQESLARGENWGRSVYTVKTQGGGEKGVDSQANRKKGGEKETAEH